MKKNLREGDKFIIGVAVVCVAGAAVYVSLNKPNYASYLGNRANFRSVGKFYIGQCKNIFGHSIHNY